MALFTLTSGIDKVNGTKNNDVVVWHYGHYEHAQCRG